MLSWLTTIADPKVSSQQCWGLRVPNALTLVQNLGYHELEASSHRSVRELASGEHRKRLLRTWPRCGKAEKT